MSQQTADDQGLVLYCTNWCGYCRRLRTALDDAGIAYTDIDIEHDADAAAFVESVNGGNQMVPTVRYADGTTATNPTISEVRAALGR